jgi:hypothetical protein
MKKFRRLQWSWTYDCLHNKYLAKKFLRLVYFVSLQAKLFDDVFCIRCLKWCFTLHWHLVKRQHHPSNVRCTRSAVKRLRIQFRVVYLPLTRDESRLDITDQLLWAILILSLCYTSYHLLTILSFLSRLFLFDCSWSLMLLVDPYWFWIWPISVSVRVLRRRH